MRERKSEDIRSSGRLTFLTYAFFEEDVNRKSSAEIFSQQSKQEALLAYR